MKKEHKKFMGAKVEDTVTGASGIVTCISYYYNGCVRLLVEPRIDKDGKRPEAFYIDYQQAKIITPEVIEPVKSKTGGPQRSEAPR